MKSRSVTWVAFRAVGAPEFPKPLDWAPGHRCSTCQIIDDVAPADRVLKREFSGWDEMTVDRDGRRWLCRACAWAYKDLDARRQPHVTTAAGDFHQVSSTELQELLTAPTIPSDVAISVPVRGRRIILPRARWGTVISDYGPIRWSKTNAEHFAAMHALRRYGFTEMALREDYPRLGLMHKHPLVEQGRIGALWSGLTAARADRILLGFLIRATRTW